MYKLKLTLASILAIAGAVIILNACTSVKIGSTIPQTDAEYGKTSVSVTLEAKNSGGSGVVIRSTSTKSWVLTNKHVCNLIQQGGLVNSDQGSYPIASFRVYPKHDLCLVEVMADLHMNTKLAPSAPKEFDAIVVAGHPRLLPTIITKGHFAKHLMIELMIDTEKCDGSEDGQDSVYCMFLGVKPIIQSFESQVTSALIMPGSSGSGVFNSKGELSGLVFAGPGDGLGFGFIVPYEYVADFLHNAGHYKARQPSKEVKPHNLFRQLTALEKICNLTKNQCGTKSHAINYEL